MNNLFTITCCTLAGLAGWWGMSLCEAEAKPVPANTPVAAAAPVDDHFTVQATVQKLRQARPGSAEISRIATLLSAVPTDSLNDLQNELYGLPPSTARQFALALIQALAQDSSADPSAPPPADAEPPANAFRELEEEMADGAITPDSGSGGPGLNRQALRDWVSADPVMATAAILKMPAGTTRERAVDIAAEVMSLTDPAASLEFVLQSGEPRPGWGAARAWGKLITGPAHAGGPSPSPEEFLHRMTRDQQDSLFSEMAEMAGLLDDSNLNPNTPSGGSDLAAIARTVLEAAESGPGFEMFIIAVAEDHPRVAAELEDYIYIPIQPDAGSHAPLEITIGPVQTAALEILTAARVERLVRAGEDPAEMSAMISWDTPLLDDNSVLNRASASVVSSLAEAGRLPEAIKMLDGISDPGARTSALKGLLPAWMDTDPAAARAAFDATPMTALERERWERHPAFLLHQTGEGR